MSNKIYIVYMRIGFAGSAALIFKLIYHLIKTSSVSACMVGYDDEKTGYG